MEIVVGKTAGFCFGVKRAVDGAKEQINKNKKIFCLGEIVHNKQVVDELESEGIIFINNIEEANGKTIIRAHGVEKNIYEKANELNIELVDYTCPNVLKIHKIADEYSKNGYYIFLCGSKKHPENIGTISHCGNNYSVIEKEDDVFKALDRFKKSKFKKLLLISQTTYSLEKFYKIEEIIRHPDKLNILDINEYINKQREVLGNTEFEYVKFTIKLIKEELTSPFHDPRKEKIELNATQIFHLLIGDENFCKGMIVVATVTRIVDEHIHCKLQNNLLGILWYKDVVDELEKDSKEKVKELYKPGTVFEARVKNIDYQKFIKQ